MKQFYLLVLVVFTSLSTFATVITANSGGGDWGNAATWSLNRLPQNGDTIVIPAGVTVTVTTSPSLVGVYFDLSGTLKFTQNAAHITFDNTTYITISSTGLITSNQGNSSDQVKWGTTTIYKSGNGGTGDVTGPKSWGTPPQPSPIPLPVKFASFSLAHQQSNVLVQWATAQEMNSKSFIIERSNDGKNWVTIATVSAAGESNTFLAYSYTDRNVSGTVVYYRVKEVDIDNSFTYTSVKSIRMDNSSVDVKIIPASNNTLYVNFSQQVRSNVVMRLISVSGQVISQQAVSNPVGQVNFSTSNHSNGIYILSITDGHDFVISKKVAL